MQLILNIKQIVIRNKEGKAGKMYLKIKGSGIAHVSDIKADEHLELINPEHVIAHVAEDGDLDIEFFVECGRGYRAAQWPTEKALQDDNRIYLDAMFSPIKKVTFDVEKTRVGGEIDYDKLICRIYTDGSENPVDMLHYAVSVLRTQLEHFLAKPEILFNDISQLPQEAVEERSVGLDKIGIKGVSVDLLLKPIEELELSVRAHNCLVNAGVKRIVDLVNLSEDDALNIKNFGRKSLGELKDGMKAFGLSFGMDIKESDLEKVLEGRAAINS
jgi:DNA-directed RNA polymerase subunit alpha